MKTWTVSSDDAVALHVRQWQPVEGEGTHGTVLIVHGLGEHIGRYEHVVRDLVARGWRVIGYDQRGHGLSAGGRGQLAHSDSLLRDLSRVLDETHLASGGVRVLLGHSMGGAVAARFVAEGLSPAPAAWYRQVDALALSSPALAADLNPVQRVLMATLGTLAPNLAVNNGLPISAISRDTQVVARYRADPLVHDRISPRLARFILDAGEHVRAAAARWNIPTLLLWAGADRCVAPRGSAEFAAAAQGDSVRARCFEPLFHEIFNEPEQREVLGELGRWLHDQRRLA